MNGIDSGNIDFGNLFGSLFGGGVGGYSPYSSRYSSSVPPSAFDDLDDEDDENSLEIEIARLKSENANLKDEFDSYRKRVHNTLETEKRLIKRKLFRDFLNEFVVYMVNTYKGKKTIAGNMGEEDYLILKKLNDFLDSSGVVPMEDATGKEFDYNTMEAVYTDRDGGMESGKVTKVIYNGFLMDGEVILPQRVAVAG